MMGRRIGVQEQLFYSFNLDTHIPADHLLRRMDQILDLGELREHLAPFYSHTGRPWIDPELMIRVLIIGYCFGIRSRAAPVPRSASEPRVSVVLPPGPRGERT
jgi:transposase-like protein DUF772